MLQTIEKETKSNQHSNHLNHWIAVELSQDRAGDIQYISLYYWLWITLALVDFVAIMVEPWGVQTEKHGLKT